MEGDNSDTHNGTSSCLSGHLYGENDAGELGIKDWQTITPECQQQIPQPVFSISGPMEETVSGEAKQAKEWLQVLYQTHVTQGVRYPDLTHKCYASPLVSSSLSQAIQLSANMILGQRISGIACGYTLYAILVWGYVSFVQHLV